jgi:hypothetical protein
MPDQPARRPYTARSVQYVDLGTVVTALYIPDAQQAEDPAYVLENILRPEYENVETVAEMTRHYKREGATFSGWIVRSGPEYGEPIPNKREALAQLRREVAEYFRPRGER